RKATGGACVVNAGGVVPSGYTRYEIDATPLPDPPSVASIAIDVADVTNAGGKLGVPNVSVDFGTNGAHAFCWFDQNGATRKLVPSEGSDAGIGMDGVGCWNAGGPVSVPPSWQMSATSPAFRSVEILLNELTSLSKNPSSESVTMLLLIQPTPTIGSTA